MKRYLLISIGLLPVIAAAQGPALKVYSGAPDTIYSAETTLVCVTDPGATATVDGEDVKVYRTGSFGKRIALKEGDNTVTVIASRDGVSTSETLDIYRSTAPNTSVGSDAEPAEVRWMQPQIVTTGPGAYLQYGNGGDRLGGSKMGYIDRGIALRAIGEKGPLLCVRLAEGRNAYIPRSCIAPGGDIPAETVNTGSWTVADAGDVDRVTVSLPCRLAYHYTTDLEPNTIAVDIFGATDNSNWITQRTASLGIIDYVDFRQIGSDTYRVIIRLKDRYQWGFKVGYVGDSNSLAIDVRHRPASLALKDLTIGLDAGHGGPFPGAISPSGLKEKDVNLDIVLHLRDILRRKGARVVLTREGDTGPSMTERKDIWRQANVDLAVSVHNNSGGSPLASPGTAVLYKHLFCRPLAQAVTGRLLETGLPLFGIVQNFNFSLNSPTEFPEVLVEGMFMSSLEEEECLADPAFRRLVAEKIAAAIEDYLRMVKSSK